MSVAFPPLVDRFNRTHTNLRISVTDRCNIRCFYCMPLEDVQFRPREELLSFEEIHQVATVAAKLGITKLRLTGGEPLVRANLSDLIRQLARIPGIEDIALTTNGILLAEQAADLKAAGLHRLNVSLDTLREEIFQKLARRSGLQRVLDGIFAARNAGFENIRLNSIAIRNLTEDELIDLAAFSREHDFELRFIEFMPLDAEQGWDNQQVLTGAEIREQLTAAFGDLLPTTRPDESQPAFDFRFADGKGRIGFINPVSEPFCGTCNRLRLTAEGQFRNCLFSTTEWDARAILRSSSSLADKETQLVKLLRDCTTAKKRGHGIDEPGFVQPERAMYQIGG